MQFTASHYTTLHAPRRRNCENCSAKEGVLCWPVRVLGKVFKTDKLGVLNLSAHFRSFGHSSSWDQSFTTRFSSKIVFSVFVIHFRRELKLLTYFASRVSLKCSSIGSHGLFLLHGSSLLLVRNVSRFILVVRYQSRGPQWLCSHKSFVSAVIHVFFFHVTSIMEQYCIFFSFSRLWIFDLV